LVPAGDVPALHAALTRLLGDAELRARLGRTARCHAETQFDLDVQARKLVDVYRAQSGARTEA
jgi:glycosyltransferase involved in cell wall biosynthesis